MLRQISIKHEQGMNWKRVVHHEAKEFHFYMVTYGTCLFRLNEQEVLAKKGDFILTPQLCSVEEATPNLSLHEKFSFHFVALDTLLELLPMLRTDYIIHLSSGLFDRALESFRPIWKEQSEELSYTNLRAGSFILDTLALWQRELDRGELAPASVMHINRMKSYIQTHYREHITKEHLGDYIRRSANYAANLFKKGTGQTISEYVHMIRMKTAIYMLSESLLSITEISIYLGYSDVSYFQRIFKRTFGKPASEFMKERPKHN